ncbi:MAG: DinB family protein [Acidobacteriota bacterium]
MRLALNQAIEILERTPATLRSLLSDLSAGWVTRNEGPDTWSPFDVVGHLIHGEETDWIERIKTILEHGEAAAFEPFDRFAMLEKSKGKTFGELLDSFEALRKRNLQTLSDLDLTEEELSRKGIHPALGTVTLEQLIATWVVHDLNHLAQIARVMAKQYQEAVGPWEEYLRILQR